MRMRLSGRLDKIEASSKFQSDENRQLAVVPDGIPENLWRPHMEAHLAAHPEERGKTFFVLPEVLGMKKEPCPKCGSVSYVQRHPAEGKEPARCCTQCSGECIYWGKKLVRRHKQMLMMEMI